ncbi:MAG TPA: hypothetical protein VJH03_21970 [Blastocatellia bacterium]|nr:hypothetical protein [Blastocatellia bacterium]
MASQKENGAWGQDDVATTALSIIALLELATPVDQWELSSEVRQALKKGAAFLFARFEENRWEHAIWDTAVATRALFFIDDQQYGDFVKQRIAWLIRETEHPANYGPHHMAQSIITLVTASVHKDILQRNCNHLEQSLNRTLDGYSPYVLGQSVEALCLGNPKSEIIPNIVEFLKEYLSTARLDNASFQNICLALQGLWVSPGKSNTQIGRLSSASLFGSTCFRDTGSWYNSELFTAWALITLARFSQEVVLQTPYSELLYEYDQLRAESEDELAQMHRANRTRFVLNLAVAAAWAVLLGVFVTYTSLKNDMFEWLKWALPTVIGILAAYNVRAVFKKS